MVEVIIGSLVCLLRKIGTWLLRKKSRYLAPLPPILTNTLLVPYVLRYGYGEPLPIPFLMATVGIGEIAACGIMGLVVLTVLNKYRKYIFRTA